jgi:hypothetical protein
MQDIDFLLKANSLGVIVHENDDVALNNIKEWILTPVNDIYGMPYWGNEFHLFRHNPADETLELQLEAHIVTKLPVDIPSISINGIRVTANEIDDIIIVIGTSLGVVRETIIKL